MMISKILNFGFPMFSGGLWASGRPAALTLSMAIALNLIIPAQARAEMTPATNQELELAHEFSMAEVMATALTKATLAQATPAPAEILSYEFVSETAGFSVLMPSPPVEQEFPDFEEIEDGRIFVQIRIEDGGSLAIYFAGYADYVGDLRTPEAIETALRGFVFSFAQEGEIRSQRRLSLGDYTGVEVESFSPDALSLNLMRGYVVNQRFYFTGIFVNPFAFFGGTATPIVELPATAAPFLDSFQLLE